MLRLEPLIGRRDQYVPAPNLGSLKFGILFLNQADDLLLGKTILHRSSAPSLRAYSTSNRGRQRGADHPRSLYTAETFHSAELNHDPRAPVS